jgi:uncharacterized protein YjdB
MKNFFNGLFAIMLIATTSCQNEESFDTGISPGTIVEAQFQPVIPASIKNLSSGSGGIGNLTDGTYDLRYILEVWAAGGNAPVHRDVITVADYSEPVRFQANLPAAVYKFVFWADFVTQGTKTDLIYTTGNAGGLKDIAWNTNTYALSSDLRDAYYAIKDVDLTNGNTGTGNVELKRPFGKLRILATDLYTESIVPDKAVITYTQATPPVFRKGFNAFAGEPTATTISAAGNLESTPVLETIVTVNGTTYNNAYLLAFDYFLRASDLTAVSFDIALFDDQGVQIGATKSISSVPVGVNKLTTVIGAFSSAQSNNADYIVIVDDDFDNGEDVYTTTIASVSLSKTELELNVNDEETLVATVLPDNAANKDVTWESDAPTIASVDQTGKVTALAVGSANITATSVADNTKTATCAVTVSAVSVPGSISFDGVADGTDVELTYTDGTTDNLTVTGGAITPSTAIKTIKSIKIDTGNDILIGRKAAQGTTISLKIDGTAVALRAADASGFIPIGSYAEFLLIKTNTATLGDSYKMEADLDFMNEPWPWALPTGGDNVKFTGTFDGAHHAVSNLVINGTSNTIGLFGYLSGNALIKNLGIASGAISTTGVIVGSFAGKMEGTATIIGCYNKASVTSKGGTGNQAGGIVGWSIAGTDCKIIACYNAGSVQGASYVGGIVGYATVGTGGMFTVTTCYNTGNVTGTGAAAAVAGIAPEIPNGGSVITACYNTGTIAAGANEGAPIGANTPAKRVADYALTNTNNANVTIFSDTAWPSTTDNAEWGTGDGSGSGTYWKSLGSWNGGSPVYPKLFFEN